MITYPHRDKVILTQGIVASKFLCVVFRERPGHSVPREGADRSLQLRGNDIAAEPRWSRASIFGGHKAVVRPVPIPNTAVKHSIADGSGFIDSARVGSRQSFKQNARTDCPGVFSAVRVFTGFCVAKPR